MEREFDLVIVFALPGETRPLLARLRRGGELRNSSPGVWSAHNKCGRIAVLRTGIGESRANSKVGEFLASHGASKLVSCGFGGGLHTNLETGDIVLAEEVTCPNGEEVISSDPNLLAIAESHPPDGNLLRGNLRHGRLVTSDHVVADAAEKARLANSTAACIVDMETLGIARAAQNAGVPALFTRCVVDPAAVSLPGDIALLVDGEGRPRPTRIAASLLRHPGRIRDLARLGRWSRLAAERCANFVEQLLENLARESDDANDA